MFRLLHIPRFLAYFSNSTPFVVRFTFRLYSSANFIISIIFITACCIISVKNEKLVISEECDVKLDIKKAVLYSILFVLSIVIVFRIIPYWIGLIVIPVILLIVDRNALREVDYPLLLTFCAFFVFSGNTARIPVIRDLLGSIIDKHTLIFGVLSCQVISNVPSAILLSHFTDKYNQLLVAVNIGGAGTLIASLASLITFREYVKNEPEKIGIYIKKFSAYNFAILAVLVVLMGFIFGF